jgi:hypothetical protein
MLNRGYKKISLFGAIPIILFVVAGGTLVLFYGLATGAFASFEAEGGVISGSAKVGTIGGASGGKAVVFGTDPAPIPTNTPAPDIESYDEAILSDLPVGYWGMRATSTIEPDLVSQGKNGTYYGNAPAIGALPNGDGAAVFNGINNYLSIPTSPNYSIPTTGELTWEAWIRPDNLQSTGAANGYSDWMGKCAEYSPTCEWEARMYTSVNSQNRCNRLSAYAFNSGAGLGSGADWQPNCGKVQAGEWLHVVAEYQTKITPAVCSSAYPGTIDIWVNGIKWNQSYHGTTGCMSQYQVIPRANNSPINIGVMAGEYWFSGSIGKVAIYDHLLSQDQINRHYSKMTGKLPSGSCSNTCISN